MGEVESWSDRRNWRTPDADRTRQSNVAARPQRTESTRRDRRRRMGVRRNSVRLACKSESASACVAEATTDGCTGHEPTKIFSEAASKMKCDSNVLKSQLPIDRVLRAHGIFSDNMLQKRSGLARSTMRSYRRTLRLRGDGVTTIAACLRITHDECRKILFSV